MLSNISFAGYYACVILPGLSGSASLNSEQLMTLTFENCERIDKEDVVG
jgi:hypothetical protein